MYVYVRVCVCMYVCVCVCVYMCMCTYVCLLSVRLVRCLSVCGGNSRRRWCCDSHLSIIKDGSSAPWEPIEAIHWPITNVNWPQSPRPWHMTQANRQQFSQSSNSPANFGLSFMSLGLVLSRSGHSPIPHTHMLSPSTSLSIILSLMANLIAIESRDDDDDDGREAKRDEEDIPIGNIRPRRRWLRTLSRWPLSISRLCLTPPQLCLSSNTKDCEELIGSKGTEYWHLTHSPESRLLLLFVACPSIA